MKLKVLFFSIFLLFRACSSVDKDQNTVVIATYDKRFSKKWLKELESMIKFKIIYFDQKISPIKQVMHFKPDFVYAASNINIIIDKYKLTSPLLKNFSENQLLKAVNKSMETTISNDYLKTFIPLSINDYRINFKNKTDVNKTIKQIFNDPNKKIAIENDNRLILWLAMKYYRNNASTLIAANPSSNDVEKALENFINSKSKKFFLDNIALIKNWNDFEIIFSKNNLKAYAKNKKYYTLPFKNKNSLVVNTIVKTKFASKKANHILNYIVSNYDKTLFAVDSIPVLKSSSLNLYNYYENEYREDFILSNNKNYYSPLWYKTQDLNNYETKIVKTLKEFA